MTYRGRVKNGVVVLDDPVGLGEGTVVRVEPVGTSDDDDAPDGLSALFRAPERAKKTGIADPGHQSRSLPLWTSESKRWLTGSSWTRSGSSPC